MSNLNLENVFRRKSCYKNTGFVRDKLLFWQGISSAVFLAQNNIRIKPQF